MSEGSLTIFRHNSRCRIGGLILRNVMTVDKSITDKGVKVRAWIDCLIIRR